MQRGDKILKVINIDHPVITFVTYSGNRRELNLQTHFDRLGLNNGDFGYETVTDRNLFSQVMVVDNALAWKELDKGITLPDGSVFKAYFHLDPIESIKSSQIVGKSIRVE